MTLVDQGLSSASNVLAVVLVANALDEAAFGRFALAYAVLVAALGVSRSWFGTRISLIGERHLVHREARDVLGSLLLLSPALSALVLVIGWALARHGSTGLIILVAVAAPVVCMQDALRFAAVAAGRPAVAVASDAAWTACLLALLPFAGDLTGPTVLALWLCAAVAALAVAVVGLRVRPDIGGGWAALRRRHRTGESMSFGTVVGQGASLVVTGVVAAVLSPAAVGSLRGASTIVGPLNVVMAFVNLALTPVLVRRGRSRDLWFCALVATLVVAVVTCWGAVVLVLPTGWGEALLGDSWAGARSVLPWMLLEYCAVGAATASTLGLKVRHEAGMLVRQKAVVAVVTVALGCGAALAVDDVRAVAAALAVAGGVSVALGWRHLRESVHRARRSGQPVESGTP